MEITGIIQILLDVIFGLGIALLWVRFQKPAKEDPRMSRGLQLLQTKIAILEDLSDRTDKQVTDLCNLLDKKSKELQEVMLEAEKHNLEIRKSMQKSLEVAEIFEDKIPHEEIIERQNSKKYIRAAQLAHQGLSIEEIAEQVDLSMAEISMITKVNKDRLMFAEEELPEWARKPIHTHIIKSEEGTKEAKTDFSSIEKDYSGVFEAPKVEEEKLKELGKRFREVCQDNSEDLSYLENLRHENEEESKRILSLENEREVENLEFTDLSQEDSADITPFAEESFELEPPTDEFESEVLSETLNLQSDTSTDEDVIRKSEESVEEEMIKKVVFPKIDSSNLIG